MDDHSAKAIAFSVRCWWRHFAGRAAASLIACTMDLHEKETMLMHPLPTSPIRSRAAWRPADFEGDDSWIIPISEEIAEEISRSVQKLERRLR